MSLQGFIGKLQNSCTHFYSDLAQSFKENTLVRDLWLEMACEKEAQVSCLRALPSTFWLQMKKEEGLLEAVQSCLPEKAIKIEQDISLQRSFAQAFSMEEPIILKVYAPLIRHLRTEWTDHALDFYIMVKAHVARITRLIQQFSGDPMLIQRSTALLESFERAVQAPQIILFPLKRVEVSKSSKRAKTSAKLMIIKQKKKTASDKHALGNRAKSISKRPKPLVKKITLGRRRARP